MDSNDSLTAVRATPSDFCDAVFVPQHISNEKERKEREGDINLHKWKGNSKLLWFQPFRFFYCFQMF